MRHFAYGSNLSTAFIRRYCPSAQFVMRAQLPNFTVQFRHHSDEYGGGISSVIEAPGDMVHGVIYEIDEDELVALDILESVPQGQYRRDAFQVLGEDGEWHLADLYRVSNPSGPHTPSKEYVGYMVAGAKEHHLDPEYLARFESLLLSLDA
jgi:gamma-glutamylcyclotransferase